MDGNFALFLSQLPNSSSITSLVTCSKLSAQSRIKADGPGRVNLKNIAVATLSGSAAYLALTSSLAISSLEKLKRAIDNDIAKNSRLSPSSRRFLPFASASLSSSSSSYVANGVVEPDTGISFSPLLTSTENVDDISNALSLLGVGVRKKSLFGLASLNIYAFGLYAPTRALLSSLGPKYSSLGTEAIRTSRWLLVDLAAEDVPMTVKLVIHYKSLKIGQVRSAFEDSIGGKIKEISGKEDKYLLHSFTKLFSDDIKLHKGAVIELMRSNGYVLTTKIDGKVVGAVKSSLLSRALLELYIGDKPFDQKAKDSVAKNLSQILSA